MSHSDRDGRKGGAHAKKPRGRYFCMCHACIGRVDDRRKDRREARKECRHDAADS